MVMAEIRRAVEERFATGEYIPHLLQALTERGVKSAMRSVMQTNSVPHADEYRANVLARIRVRQGISRLYRSDYWMDTSSWNSKLIELQTRLQVLNNQRAKLRKVYANAALDFVDLTYFEPQSVAIPIQHSAPRVRIGKCKKRKMKRKQRDYYEQTT